MKREIQESTAKKLAKTILQDAHKIGANIRELEEAYEIAIRYCREAFVPTPGCPETDLES